MFQASDDITESARKNESVMLRALALRGQKVVAELLGTSEATVSRWKDGDLEKTAKSLAAMGLKVVPEDAEAIERGDLDAMVHATKEWAAHLSADRLIKKNHNGECQ